MSGGGGNNRQMPMASNRGQQQQQQQMGMQPQMGMAPQSGMFGQPQLNQQQQQAFDQMRQSNFLAPQGPQGPFETPQPMPQMGDGQQMPIPQGIQDLVRQRQNYEQSQMGGPSMPQLVNGPDPQVQRNIRPTNMQPSAIGSQTAYRPSMGAIDGRDLTKKLDITKRRQMDDLPGAIQNNLPPALKRPTQGGMRGVRV